MEFNAKEQLTGLIEWMRQRMAACGGKTAVFNCIVGDLLCLTVCVGCGNGDL